MKEMKNIDEISDSIPHPSCDDGCMYHCTEGGKFPPKCKCREENIVVN